MGIKVVLAGPPRSGKSCLRQGLKDAVRSIPGAPYPYIITACPDGEGAWFQEAVERDGQLAAELKADYKSAFTPQFVRRVAESVDKCSLELTLIDIGGIPSPENRQICRSATHAILLAGDLSRLPEWRTFFASLQVSVLAEIWSDYHGQSDTVPVQGENGVWKGSVHHLERGEPNSARPTVVALAQILVDLANHQE